MLDSYARIRTSSLITVLILLSLSVIQASPVKREDVSTELFMQFHGFNTSEELSLRKARDDAVLLAHAALDIEHDGYGYVDFETEAAIDYFGPHETNEYTKYIVQTLTLAPKYMTGRDFPDHADLNIVAYKGGKGCYDTSPAYMSDPENPENGSKLPEFHFCQTFFDVLRDHEACVKEIVADKTGAKKQNLRNLRSKATTFFHEMLHIRTGPIQICYKGCEDHEVSVNNGKETKAAYKPGRVKLLAEQNQVAAARNNDNYVYFAMSRYMEKYFHVYPQYPAKWDASKSAADNEARENQEPGAPSTVQDWELDDSASSHRNTTSPPNTKSLAAADYPEWYRPKLTASSAILPKITPPLQQPPPLVLSPKASDVHCETTRGSPAIDDCFAASTTLLKNPQNAIPHGSKGDTWWAAYNGSCALAIMYNGDWTSDCSASFADLSAHLTSISTLCGDGDIGTVGGHVDFAGPKCPAQIEIIHTSGSPPPTPTSKASSTSATPSLPTPSASDKCSESYQFFDDHFDIWGSNFDHGKLGDYGSNLLANLRHCGSVTHWGFDFTDNPASGKQGNAWHAYGNLPMGTKSCIGSQLVATGGNTADGCVGPG